MQYSKLPIDKILLSCDNPRLEQSFNEIESIINMINDQHEKLVVLAKDIIDNGLSPIDSIAVIPLEDNNGFYEVCEGNRRICVLKILQNPTLIKDIDDGLYKKFSDLAPLTSSIDFDNIDVCIFKNKDYLSHWLRIKHMGEQGGKGLSKWNSIQKDRFNRSINGKDLLLDFWDWLIEKRILTYDEIHSITKTNWQRILRECYYPFMKIQRTGDMYHVSEEDMPAFIERIRCIQKHLSGQTVAIVYDKNSIDTFFDMVSNELYKKPYCEVVEQERAEQLLIDLGEDAVFLKEDGMSEAKNVTGVKQTSRDVFSGCDTIIPYSYAIRSSNHRINKIIAELKQIKVDQYPNACGALLRLLFELSAKALLEKCNGDNQTTKDFKQAVIGAANYLRMNKAISDQQHSAITQDADSLRLIFNGYMHDTDSFPSTEGLKNYFKAHHVFIEECIHYLEK